MPHMPDPSLDRLAGSPLFDKLTARVKDALVSAAATRRLRDGDRLLVVTLSGLLRRIDCARLGVPTRRTKAYNEGVAVHAPRLWMPVRGGLPLYVDLLGTVPDRRGFERVFGALPR